ncbi:MAG: hypothetical protein K8I27_11290 [Planctomycetes bacterium]|nr:hypothetical protein [Planctomycetota bacterium]
MLLVRKLGWRLSIALVCTLLCVGMAAAAGSTMPPNYDGLFGAASSFHAGPTEYLSIGYDAGARVGVSGSGKIDTNNTQNWTVWAKDGVKRNGSITGSEDPRWRVVITWDFELEVAAEGDSCSEHRSVAGCYGVLQKDITGDGGAELDFYHEYAAPAEVEFDLSVPDGDTTSYTFVSHRYHDGGQRILSTADVIDIDEMERECNPDDMDVRTRVDDPEGGRGHSRGVKHGRCVVL